MKYFKFVLIIFFIGSCIHEKKSDNSNHIDYSKVQGSWYEVLSGRYIEYFFDKKGMYVYNPSGNIYKYTYQIINDSILRYKKKGDFNIGNYKYYDEILEIDSTQIILKNRILKKVINGATLGMYIEEKIDYQKLYASYVNRRNQAIPLDSLIKFSGEPIDIDNIDYK